MGTTRFEHGTNAASMASRNIEAGTEIACCEPVGNPIVSGMSGARTLAPLSLILAASLFLTTLPFEHVFILAMLHAFAEAAMIGGLADWFAVVALFRHPLGIPIPHTAIIQKHRGKLTRGIVDVVQNKWLDKETIRERVQSLRLVEYFLRAMEDPLHRDTAVSLIRTVIRDALRDVKPNVVAGRVLDLLRASVTTDDILGWIERATGLGVEAGWHRVLLNAVLRNAASWLETPRVHKQLSRQLENIAENYSTTALRSVGKWFAEATNALNYDDLARTIALSLKDDLQAMETDERHPLREDFERGVRAFIDGMDDNAELRSFIDARRVEWFDNARGSAIAGLLERAADWLATDLEREDSAIMRVITAFLEERLERFRSDSEAQQRLDEWLRERIAGLVEEHHDEIGSLIRHNLDKLDNKQLVDQIEDKIGADLQYIRVNGAVVGGLVGMTIFLVKAIL